MTKDVVEHLAQTSTPVRSGRARCALDFGSSPGWPATSTTKGQLPPLKFEDFLTSPARLHVYGHLLQRSVINFSSEATVDLANLSLVTSLLLVPLADSLHREPSSSRHFWHPTVKCCAIAAVKKSSAHDPLVCRSHLQSALLVPV